jgi:hypothetical protein
MKEHLISGRCWIKDAGFDMEFERHSKAWVMPSLLGGTADQAQMRMMEKTTIPNYQVHELTAGLSPEQLEHSAACRSQRASYCSLGKMREHKNSWNDAWLHEHFRKAAWKTRCCQAPTRRAAVAC